MRLWYDHSLRKLFEIALFLGAMCVLTGCGLVGYESTALEGTDAGDAGDASSDASTSADGGLDASDGAVDDPPPPPTQLAHVCGYTSATAILNGEPTDDYVAGALASAIESGCGHALTLRSLSQDTPGLLDPTTHAPLLGASDLGLIGGDSYYHDAMIYLQASLTPLRSVDDGTRYRVTRRSTGQTHLDVLLTSITATHDYATIQIVHDPSTSSTVVVTYGYYYRGTLAGAYYFTNHVAPQIATETRGFFLLEWTNADGNADPSAGDTYTLLTTGP